MMIAATPIQAGRGGPLKLHRRAAFGEVSIGPHRPLTRENPPIAAAGAALAINYLSLGVAADLPCSRGRGGARNRADRESDALTAGQVTNLIAATAHAHAIGLPFNRMMTIHWEAAGVPLASMARATGRFTDLMAKGLARHGSRSAWLWTHENGPRNGGHCHLLAHVPAALVSRLAALQRGWLRRITGNPYRKRVILSRPIGRRLGLENSNSEVHAVNLALALGYILKGASETAASQCRLERLEPGGRIIGKRCGTSQNIGAKARTARNRVCQNERTPKQATGW